MRINLIIVRAFMTMQEWTERMQGITAAIESGNIERSTRADLVQFNAWLCHSNAGIHFAKNYGQVCETVRLHLLRSFIEELERKNALVQKLVIALTIASLIGTGVQVWYAAKADKTPEGKLTTIAAPLQPQSKQSVAPSPRLLQSSRPTKTEQPTKTEKYAPAKP